MLKSLVQALPSMIGTARGVGLGGGSGMLQCRVKDTLTQYASSVSSKTVRRAYISRVADAVAIAQPESMPRLSCRCNCLFMITT